MKKTVLTFKIVSLIFITSFMVSCGVKTTDVFVSVDGKDGNDGSKKSPLTLAAAIEKTKDLVRKGELKEGINIYVRGGKYSFDKVILLDTTFSGTKESPIVIRAYKDEEVIFDGGKDIGSDGFSKVKDAAERNLLAKSAVDNILVKTIKDPYLIKKLESKVIQTLSFNGESYLPSRFPNKDYAVFNKDADVAEVSPPGIPHHGAAHRAGNPPAQEKGKPLGWLGSVDEPRGAQAGFKDYEKEMAGSWEQWEAELKKNNKWNMLKGFISATWKLESHGVHAANAAKRTIHLSKVTSYGWFHLAVREFAIFGLLCEVDKPGEWHFDALTNKLYIYPPSDVNENTAISVPFANGFIDFNGASYVSVININVQNGSGNPIFNINEGNNNLIAGCKLTSSTSLGINISGNNNKVVSCDFVDLSGHVTMGGGVRSSSEITPANNLVENCHFYQKNFKHEKVNIYINGVGNTFRHNLVHNSIGQAINVRGNDHLVELNEAFNIGYEEGDGGAIYSGGDLSGYGNMYRYNFLHHLIHVPGKVTRAGIHLDDLQAGATCIGNVFYKSASKGIFMNAGSGHTLRDNVNLEGDLGIYNVGVGSQRTFEMQQAILKDPNHDLKNNKENYVGNAEKNTGLEGWKNDPWKTKYPKMDLVMSDTGQFGRIWPIRCVVENNFFFGNARGDSTVWSRFAPEARAKSVIKNDMAIDSSYFVNYDNLDLQFKDSIEGVPNIPFEKIGLRVDEYRKSVPDQKKYRVALKEFFKDVKSFKGTDKQINTAVVVEESY